MTKRREESDGRVVPEGRRKAVPTVPARTEEEAADRGGRATTASEQVGQQELFSETADSPQGAVPGSGRGLPRRPSRHAVPKSEDTNGALPPAMTMEEVASDENLRRAFERVRTNDGAPGPDRQAIATVRKHLDEILRTLSRTLLDGSYRPGMIRRVWIPKVGGGERGLGIPNVVDRIVQQAVHQVLGPHYEPTFHESSHGFRPGRSCHTAIAEARRYLEGGYEWVVDLDLEKFFDKVHHERLLARLSQRISDPRLIGLIRQMLRAKVVLPDGVVVSTHEGTPQGGPLSPLLSNIVLDELDRELAQRGHRFVRYADDCNIYVRSERAGHRVMASVVQFIERRLRLTVNAAKSAVTRPEERHFVGFRLRRDPETGASEVLLSKRSKDRVGERVRQLTPRNWGGSLKACITRLNAYLQGWMNFFGICTESIVRTLDTLDAHIRRRLRALQLRQWKRKRFIVKHLIRLGARAKTAWREIYKEHRSLWKLSHCGPVDYALDKAYFANQGLAALKSLYQRQPRFTIASVQLHLDLG